MPALRRALVPWLTLVVVATSSAQTPRADLIMKLDSLASDPVIANRAVGMSVAVVRGNDTLLMRAYGKAELENDIPTPANAVYKIGSITKQFTAAAILQLRDAGKLSLDDDITRHLPAFKTPHRITVRHLLDHTSGIKGLTEIDNYPARRSTRMALDSVAAWIATQPYDFAPGGAQIYNNSGFFLLGMIIEKASGMSYRDYVEKMLFAPAGMKDSYYCNDKDVITRRAHGYEFENGKWTAADYWDHSLVYAAGALCSTAGDLVKWMKALHGGKVLSPRSYKEMTSPARLNDGTVLRYGFGINLDMDPRVDGEIGHGGSIEGYMADSRWYPKEDLYVVVLMNSEHNVSPAAVLSELAGEIITPNPRPKPVAFTGDAQALVGTYSGAGRGIQIKAVITTSPQGEVLIALSGRPPRPVTWVKDWTFTPGGNTYLVFRRNGSSGPADEVRIDTAGGLYILTRQN